ncbi:hypothetical protein AB0M19_10915 [Streptomyces sp. NPDC051920]|uniref:hypothetical protein n=1 Tax=Streptomyces sp. NPDC051920 TaxID=3155523 RepID=UPI003443ECED
MWSIVDDAERALWRFAPYEAVGPLRFGMSIGEVATAMDAEGFVSSFSYMDRPHGALAQDAGFHYKDAPLYMGEEAVTAYCRKSGALAAVAIDALRGPQVSLDGLRLIGRKPSELSEQLHEYADDRGMVDTVSPVNGDPRSEELGLLIRAQRAGDILLTRAFFVADFQDWAYTVHDCVPVHEWEIR